MKQERLWIRSFLGFILFASLILPISLNLLIDPYTVFHTSPLKHELSLNQRFNKIEHLKAHPDIYNSFMLGNSRIGTTHPHILESYLPHTRFYNMTLSTGNMEDMLTHFNYLIHHQTSVKTIYLQLDYQDMIYWSHDPKSYEYTKHPDVSHTHYLRFYSDYLLILPWHNFKEKIHRNLTPYRTSHVVQDINGTGMWIAADEEKLIENDPINYIKNEPSFHITTIGIWKKNPVAYSKMLLALQNIVTLSKQHHINLILYTTPYNHAMLNCFQVDDIIQYLEDISKIHNYYFFADYNSVTLNNENYYESGHFRGKVGELIAAKIFNDPTKNTPSDFGIHITHTNFARYKSAIQHNFIEHRNTLSAQP